MEFKKGDRLYLKPNMLSQIKKERPWVYQLGHFWRVIFTGYDPYYGVCVVDYKRTKYDATESYYFSAATLELYFTKDIPHFVNLEYYV